MRTFRPIRRLSTTARRWQEAVTPKKEQKKEVDSKFIRVSPSVVLADTTIPIEKKSLTRGMAENKFEKDFLIFPEYTEIKSLENIKNYLTQFTAKLDIALDKKGDTSAAVTEVFQQHDVYAAFVHQVYGGMGFSTKDKMMLFDAIGARDLGLCKNLEMNNFAANAIQLYGTSEQRDYYLPKLATGQIQVAVCITDEISENAVPATVTGHQGYHGLLDGKKTNVINAEQADLFIVLARNEMDPKHSRFCYIFDKNAGQIKITKKETQGLQKTKFYDVEFSNIKLQSESVLGDVIAADEILSDYLVNSGVYHGASSIGFLRQLTKDLCTYASTHLYGPKPLSENPSVQDTLSNLNSILYTLESMTYYMGGMADEGLFVVNDVENSIIERVTKKALRQAIMTITDIAGFSAIDTTFDYDKKIRDSVTYMSLGVPDLSLVRAIALPVLDTFISSKGKGYKLKEVFTPSKLLFNTTHGFKLKHPKRNHFIGDYAHPALEEPCKNLEDNIYRLDVILDKICYENGTQLKTDYFAQTAIADMLEANFAMMATIARTSRDYCIGLKNADFGVAWTIMYCKAKERKIETDMQSLTDYLELLCLNPSMVRIGVHALEVGGYPMEHPMERNW